MDKDYDIAVAYMRACEEADRYMRMSADLRQQLIDTQRMLIDANDKLIAANHKLIMAYENRKTLVDEVSDDIFYGDNRHEKAIVGKSISDENRTPPTKD